MKILVSTTFNVTGKARADARLCQGLCQEPFALRLLTAMLSKHRKSPLSLNVVHADTALEHLKHATLSSRHSNPALPLQSDYSYLALIELLARAWVLTLNPFIQIRHLTRINAQSICSNPALNT